ncbi:Scr1 family TA system antitoxin-like transcriptional regulator [Streptomyces sp. MMCC 100]|uniref:Scr1 family TA system antitoxin-like transcriptional regulator n=1 Tax=Streptomyces sp. MMCC 100 TaxID=3163555 RepID=UPI0035955271
MPDIRPAVRALAEPGEYARAFFAAALPPLPGSGLELRVVQRLRRQQVLDRDSPVAYVAYVHEWALRMQFGGRRVTREQSHHLCGRRDRHLRKPNRRTLIDLTRPLLLRSPRSRPGHSVVCP